VADLPTRAQTVIVGAGIVGASAAYHLADLGMTDVLVIDQGPLFATGGSTTHAPGLVFQTNGSRTMCRIAQDSIGIYDALDLDGEPVWYGVGGLELATTPERIAELKRRQGFARSWGIEGTELLSRTECAERSPLLDPASVLGGYWIPSDGAAKGVKIAEALARRAQAAVIRFEGGVTVTGFDTTDGGVHAVDADRGRIECERVLLCAGLWGPTVGAMAGVPIPLSPCNTSSCGPIRFPSLRICRAIRGHSSRSCGTRTCPCTSVSATITTGSATTAMSRSSRRRPTSVRRAARCNPR